MKHAVWVWGGGVGRCARLGNLVPQVGEVGRALELVRAVVLALGQHEEHEEVGGEAREPEQRDHRGQLRARRGGRPQQGSVTRPWNLPTHPSGRIWGVGRGARALTIAIGAVPARCWRALTCRAVP